MKRVRVHFINLILANNVLTTILLQSYLINGWVGYNGRPSRIAQKIETNHQPCFFKLTPKDVNRKLMFTEERNQRKTSHLQ